MSNSSFLNTYLHALSADTRSVLRYGTIRPYFARLWRSRIRLNKQHYLTPVARIRFKIKYARSKYLVSWLQSRRACTLSTFSSASPWVDFNWGRVAWLYRSSDTVTNPLWGFIGRGFPKMLFRTRIREYTNAYLRPRWYRRARLRVLCAFLRRCDNMSMVGSKSSVLATHFTTPVRSNQMTYQFYLSKRWYLV